MSKLKNSFICRFFNFTIVLILTMSISKTNAQQFLPQKELSKYLRTSGKKTEKATSRINKTNKKFLKKYLKSEKKLQAKLCKTNPSLADHLFSPVTDPLFYVNPNSATFSNLGVKNFSADYFPEQDSLQTNILYLKKDLDQLDCSNLEALHKISENSANLNSAVSNSNILQQSFRRRKQVVNQVLGDQSKFKNEVLEFDKVNYYYHEKISACKELFSIPKKAEESVMKILRNNSYYKQFIQKTGTLSMFSKITYEKNNPQANLETILEAHKKIQKSIEQLGPCGNEEVAETVKQGVSQITKVKSGSYGNITNAADIPSFKPSELKSLRFIDRLRFGNNFQFSQSNTLYPTSANVGFQLSYLLSPKLKPSLGVSYVLGMGKNWNNVSISQKGIGIRAYADYKIGKIILISTGYERNASSVNGLSLLEMPNSKKWNWTTSALGGLKLSYGIGGKVAPTFSLLYDFLSDSHNPITQPLIYRVGWEF